MGDWFSSLTSFTGGGGLDASSRATSGANGGSYQVTNVSGVRTEYVLIGAAILLSVVLFRGK